MPRDDEAAGGVKRSYYIIVEGPIGVGKTTLVERLAKRLPARTVYEIFEENPFLSDFYKDRGRYAFQTEMFFLLSRFRQQEAFAQAELFQPYAVSDYLFQKSRLFARQTLTDHEFALFDEMFKILSRTTPRPDLVIYLHAPLPVLLERIAHRGRPYEANMDADYMATLCRAYDVLFAGYNESPLLSVDTTDLNFATSDEALEQMIRILHERPTNHVYLGGDAPTLFG